jgi:CHASE2 domain-containing sensor protein
LRAAIVFRARLRLVRAGKFLELGSWLAVYKNRALALVALHLVGWLLLGQAIVLPGMPEDEWLALDQWVRTGVFAVVQPADTIPVTYVDIDDALYRDTWGLPTVTPRSELARMLTALAASGSSLIVVDIDLAWGELDPAFDRYLATYRGPVPLVFVRHIEASEAGLEVFASAYDDTFAANAQWLRWAHAYFFTDGDGALREWVPWLHVCADGTAGALPSAAVLALETLRNKRLEPEGSGTACNSVPEPASRPIIYTQNFGFSGRSRNGGLIRPATPGDARSPARTLNAAFLLDGTRIDAQALLAGRVAIIGGSHSAGQDLRLTPIGILPGAVVQANTVIHVSPQLGAGEAPVGIQRMTVAAMFLVLCVLSFPVAAALLAGTAIVLVSALSYYGIFASIELAALLFVQFRVLVWLAKPFWKSLHDARWRILLPVYLRGKEGQ